MEYRTLFKNISYLASTKVIQFFTGIIRAKINAIILGTSGLGLVNQLNMLTSSSAQFTQLSMSEAVVKQVAENHKKEESKLLVAASIKAYILLVGIFLLFMITLLIIFKESVTTYIFGDTQYISYYFLAILTFPVLIINSIFFALMKGIKGIKYISKARIWIITSNLIIFVPLVILFKLTGAIIFVPISYIVTLFWNYYYANKIFLKPYRIRLGNILSAPLKSDFIKEMLTFSGFGLAVGSMAILAEFVCRSIVITNLGIDKIGLYNPIITWAGLFTGFLLPSFQTYLFPRFCESETNQETSIIINNALRLATLSLIPFVFILIPYRTFLIKVFYSHEFTEAANYLPYHFLGVVFYIWFVVFGQTMTPKGFIKQHGFFRILFYSLSILVTYIFVPIIGLYGWMLQFIVSPFLFFIIYFLYIKTKLEFKISRSNIITMSYVLIGISFLFFIDFNLHEFYLKIIGPLFVICTFLFLTENEKKFIVEKIHMLKSRKTTN